jgi:hypothetical protein
MFSTNINTLGPTRQITRLYNFVNSRDGGLGPVYFTNNYLFRNNNPIPVPTPPIPPDFNTATCEILVKYYKALIVYENTLLGIDTVFNELFSPYNRPYIELLYPDDESEQFITYISLNSANYTYTIIADELEIEPGVLSSEQRCFVYNSAYIVPVNLEKYPQKKIIKIKGTNFYQQMNIGIIVPFLAPESRYSEVLVYRSSIYVYDSGTIVYLLVDTINQKIYVMQSYSFYLNSDANLTSLYILSKKLVNMPEGFIYVILTVKPGACLIAVSTITTYPAITITDELDNTYQYLYPTFNPQLYSQFNLSK